MDTKITVTGDTRAMHAEQRRWRHRPDPSTWGDFGPDDALGRMNLLTPRKVKEGMDEVLEHQAFALGLPLTLPGGNALNPNRLPPVHRPNLRSGMPNSNCKIREIIPGATDVLNDDLVVLHTQYSTQWDALVHAGSLFDADGDGIAEAVYYNGYRAERDVRGPKDTEDCGMTAGEGRTLESTADYGPLGVHTLAAHPVQGRAVMVDLAYHYGTEHRIVGWKEISLVLEADGIDVRPGDIVTIHTGYASKLMEMKGNPDPEVLHQYGAVLNGRDKHLLQWITDSRICAIAADNNAVELYPGVETDEDASILPLHEHCLFKLGMNLGELWHLSELAAHLRRAERTAFLLTAPPLNLPGAAGSPLNPIATV